MLLDYRTITTEINLTVRLVYVKIYILIIGQDISPFVASSNIFIFPPCVLLKGV